MCYEILLKFKECEHDMNLGVEDCGKTCPSPTVKEELQDGQCPECIGNHEVPQKPVVFYKWAEQSTVCDHEFGHIITDVERDPDIPEVVLIVESPSLCPECSAAGLANRPTVAGVATVKGKTVASASIMPASFAGVPRMTLGPAAGTPTFKCTIATGPRIASVAPKATVAAPAATAAGGAGLDLASLQITTKPTPGTNAPKQRAATASPAGGPSGPERSSAWTLGGASGSGNTMPPAYKTMAPVGHKSASPGGVLPTMGEEEEEEQ